MNNKQALYRTLIDRLGPNRILILLIAFTSLLHLYISGRVGLGTDEAHYALYALHLDWSYFDHPPLVGWLQALVLPFSQSETALRLIPITLFAASSLALFSLTRELFPDEGPWLGLVSVLLMHSGIMFQLIGLGMLPESPLLLFGLLAMLMLVRAMRSAGMRYWLLFGLCMGLAGLSKYTAVLLIASTAIFISLEHKWDLLKTPGPWISAIIALLIISPVIYWNATHDWASFSYQWTHGTGQRDWKLTRILLAQLAQFIVFSPLLFVGGYIALINAFRRPRDRGVNLVISLSLPLIIFLNLSAGKVVSLPHWLALAWAGLCPLTARWLIQTGFPRPWRIFAWVSAIYSLLMIAFTHSLLIHPWYPFDRYNNPLHDLYGWQKAALHGESLRQDMARTPGPVPILFTGYWTEASRLAWYARPTPVVVTDRGQDQFDIWYGSPAENSRGIYIVSHKSRYEPRTSGNHSFRHCKKIDQLDITVGKSIANSFYYYRCKAYRVSVK